MRKKKGWLAVFLFLAGGILFMTGDALNNDVHEMSSLLPREIDGWKAEEDELFDEETIFDYINGAGEVYRAYSFRQLFVRRFVQEGQPDIIVDLFDMGSPGNAFGVFTHSLEGEEVGIGQGSTYIGELLSFWKGHYFVSLYAEMETEVTRNVLLSLGRKIDDAIREEGRKPELLDLLPQEIRDEKDIRFFHNHLILNYHYYVADENILLLGPEMEAVLASSGEGEERFRLLLIRYPDEGRASGAYESFTRVYMPDAVEPGLVRTEDGKWTAVRRKAGLLLVVFDAPSVSAAKKLLDRIEGE